MSLQSCIGKIETTDQETALDRVISAVNFVDPGLDFFEVFVWIDFPEKHFPVLLPISAACHMGHKYLPYYRLRKGQGLFTAKMVEESYAAKAARGAERVYGILVKYTPKEGCMAPFPRAPDEPTAAAAVARGRTIYLFPQTDTLSACHNLYGHLNSPAFVCAPFDELVPNLEMPRWTIDRVPPNGVLVDFPDDADERLKNEVFSGGARIWPESPKLVYGCDWENFREFLLGCYKEWLIEGCELLTFFGNDACGKRLIEPREAVARHPTLRDWLNNGPIRSFDPVEDSTPPILRPSFPSWEKRSQADVSMQLEKFAAGEAARKVTNRNALVSWKLRIEIGRFFGARYHSGDERASGAFLRLNKAIDESGFLKALMADVGNTECLAACREACRAGRGQRNGSATK